MLVATVAALIALVFATVALSSSGGSSKDSKTAKPGTAAARQAARVAARGYTSKLTVPLYAANQARPSTPRPAKLPPMVRSTGDCATAMNAVRDFQDANPSGLALTSEQAPRFSGLLLAVGPGPDAKCSDQLSQLFRQQEIDPWMTWQPSAANALPTPTAGKSAPRTHSSGRPSGRTAKTSPGKSRRSK